MKTENTNQFRQARLEKMAKARYQARQEALDKLQQQACLPENPARPDGTGLKILRALDLIRQRSGAVEFSGLEIYGVYRTGIYGFTWKSTVAFADAEFVNIRARLIKSGLIFRNENNGLLSLTKAGRLMARAG